MSICDRMELELEIHYTLVQKDLLQIKSPKIYLIELWRS